MLYARDFRRKAYEALNGKWALAVGTGFIAALLGGMDGPVNIPDFNWKEQYNGFFQPELLLFYLSIVMITLAFALIAFFFGGAVTLGYCRFNKNVIKGTNPRFNDLFSNFHIFWKAFLLQLLIGIFIILWTFLLIIPGIIATFSYAMAPYIMDENPEMSVMEAIRRSKEMMNGNRWRLFCLELSFIGWAILCLFTCGIGILWLNPYIYAAEAAFYLEISGHNENSNQGYNNYGYNSNDYYNNGYNNNDYKNSYDKNGYNGSNNYDNNNNQQFNNGYNNNYNDSNNYGNSENNNQNNMNNINPDYNNPENKNSGNNYPDNSNPNNGNPNNSNPDNPGL